MASFKAASREYVLRITVNSLAVVKDALGIHLAELDAGSPPLSVRLWADPILAAAVVYWCLRAQNQATYPKPPDTLADFLDEIEGSELVELQRALGEALTDFFHRGRRTDLTALLQQTRTTMEAAATHQKEAAENRAKQVIENLELEKERAEIIAKQTRQKLVDEVAKLKSQGVASASPGSSPDSPASTPATARSASSTTPPAPAAPTSGTAQPM